MLSYPVVVLVMPYQEETSGREADEAGVMAKPMAVKHLRLGEVRMAEEADAQSFEPALSTRELESARVHLLLEKCYKQEVVVVDIHCVLPTMTLLERFPCSDGTDRPRYFFREVSQERSYCPASHSLRQVCRSIVEARLKRRVSLVSNNTAANTLSRLLLLAFSVIFCQHRTNPSLPSLS